MSNILPFRRGGHAPSDGVAMATATGQGFDPTIDMAQVFEQIVRDAIPGQAQPPADIARQVLIGMSERGWVWLRTSDL